MFSWSVAQNLRLERRENNSAGVRWVDAINLEKRLESGQLLQEDVIDLTTRSQTV